MTTIPSGRLLLACSIFCLFASTQICKAQALVSAGAGKVASTTGYLIIVDKAANALYVYNERGRILTYRAVFGEGEPGDKLMEGDNKTPLGLFHVIAKKIHPQWGPFLLLDYPTQDSYRKFNEAKAEGRIPASAHIGGGIGIHGTRWNEDFAVDRLQNWTWGCISVKHEEARYLYDLIPVGTEVLVR
ncbi:L,D-transpeptidase family protein [Dinghuibacter silviterrae]|uniref:L,D-transpeptidase-like protein n=1 Tax=Dinghuibacter silviterrae TaxID=1539049 RepID=A0A4R8DP89_9BACT|nr:L,D-transpeptidase [Dinghuibacter silviterrae]TDW99535.1 L,D-transpeptidase-like protein [Dinghuibacter silviterrae]